MYRLAVCEDENSVRRDLCLLCHEILEEEGIDHRITEFSSGKELAKRFEEEEDAFDLLILDICLEESNGIELARSLRWRENRVSIIFVTGYEEYALEGYGVQPVHFLLKPVKKENLAEALWTDWKLNQEKKIVRLKFGSRTAFLPIHEILYLESWNHEVVVHRKNTKNTYRLSLTEAQRQISSRQFCRCHNSYLVNMEYVEEISRTELILPGNLRIPVGRAYYRELQQAFIRFINQ